MRKKFLNVVILLFSSTVILFADSFLNIIQDLAMQTACIGSYSSTQAGGGWYDDPHDYYTPQRLAARFKKMSGERTRTQTFYGVCFDYAQAAWDDIKTYKSDYNKAGMKESQWYIAVVDENPNLITLYDPVSKDKADRKMNGVYLKKKLSYPITAHGNATRHAWLWIQHQNGTWYWIDPTWTDNTGYVWYGVVSNGKEIQYTPQSNYCAVIAPVFQQAVEPKLETITTHETNSVPKQQESQNTIPMPNINPIPLPLPQLPSQEQKTVPSRNRSNELYMFVLEVGYSIPALKSLDENDGLCLSVSLGDGNYAKITTNLQLDYYDFNEVKDLLFGLGIGVHCNKMFAIYCGGGLGRDIDTKQFAWKINGGTRVIFGRFSLRGDIALIGEKDCLFGLYAGVLF